jgi:glutamine synthetase
MPGMLTLEELVGAVSRAEIDTVLVCQVDMQGRLMGKRFQAEFFLDSAWRETHSCNYLLATDLEMETVPGYAASGWDQGYGDYVMRPDLTTLRRVPWLEGTALVLCDVLDPTSHAPVPHSPRAILQRQLERLRERGLEAVMASELEFFLFDDSYQQAHSSGYRSLQTASYYNEDYHIFQTSKEEDVMRAIRTSLQGAGIDVECSKGEACAGQEEVNIRYCDALAMADRHAILKNGCKEIAFQKGRALTFMAKWDTRHAGNSSHIHQSLREIEGSHPVFYDSGAIHGMSTLMQHYLAGQLAYAGDLTYFLAPYVNSYKRYCEDTFAPTKAVWSLDNRTAGFRVCGAQTESVRVECRIGGADLNPYLAFAALVAAGLAGIDEARSLEAPISGNAYRGPAARDIPKTLPAALTRLKRSKMLREALGEEVVAHYVHAGEWEHKSFERQVTDWEVARGFERA